jgi:hypothetical protein
MSMQSARSSKASPNSKSPMTNNINSSKFLSVGKVKSAVEAQLSSDSSVTSFNDTEAEQFDQIVERILRDSIIKSFMITFTDPSNQHLLMNPDLIEIAFNCIEYSTEIKT